jgi:hypothetical protein
MSSRVEDFVVRKEVQEKLKFIMVQMLGPRTRTLNQEDSPIHKTQRDLSKLLGISQPETSRLIRGTVTPHSTTLATIRKLYLTARCFHWDADIFYPICAVAKQEIPHAYRSGLPSTMMQLLHSLLEKEPLYPIAASSQKCEVRVDLHVRAAKLPVDIEAYSFGNDRLRPTVFVVLVSRAFSFDQQYEKAWDEVRAHVIRSPQTGRNAISVARPILCHYEPTPSTMNKRG